VSAACRFASHHDGILSHVASCFPFPPRSGGEGSRVGGGAANAAVSEFAVRPPTPDPSPPRADARGGRGEESEFNFQTACSIPAAHFARVVQLTSALLCRGRRECRAPDAPAAACATVEVKMHTRQSGHTGITRHSLRNGFNGFLRALPGDRAFLPPSPVKIAFHELDASVGASGPHDFSVRFRTVRYRRVHVHRSPSRVRDDRDTPLEWDGMAENIPMIWGFGKSEYFSGRGWTGGPAKHEARH
jgi:hypothetical protein